MAHCMLPLKREKSVAATDFRIPEFASAAWMTRQKCSAFLNVFFLRDSEVFKLLNTVRLLNYSLKNTDMPPRRTEHSGPYTRIRHQRARAPATGIISISFTVWKYWLFQWNAPPVDSAQIHTHTPSNTNAYATWVTSALDRIRQTVNSLIWVNYWSIYIPFISRTISLSFISALFLQHILTLLPSST